MINYIQIVKLLAVVSIIATCIVAIYNKGYDAAETKYRIALQEQNNKLVADYTKRLEQAAEQTTQNIINAQRLDHDYSKSLKDIDSLNARIRVLANDSSVYKRPVCVARDTSTKSKDSDPVEASGKAIEYGLSKELEGFLLDRFTAADQVTIYAQTAHKFINELCLNTETFICSHGQD